MPDILSRLQKTTTQQDLKEKDGVLDILLADILLANILPDAYVYVGTIIEVIDEFKERLVKGYSDDK